MDVSIPKFIHIREPNRELNICFKNSNPVCNIQSQVSRITDDFPVYRQSRSQSLLAFWEACPADQKARILWAQDWFTVYFNS